MSARFVTRYILWSRGMFWCLEHRKKSFFTRLTRPYADIWQIQRFHIVKMKKMERVLLGMIDTVCENVV